MPGLAQPLVAETGQSQPSSTTITTPHQDSAGVLTYYRS
jgi:hypothetical protein